MQTGAMFKLLSAALEKADAVKVDGCPPLDDWTVDVDHLNRSDEAVTFSWTGSGGETFNIDLSVDNIATGHFEEDGSFICSCIGDEDLTAASTTVTFYSLVQLTNKDILQAADDMLRFRRAPGGQAADLSYATVPEALDVTETLLAIRARINGEWDHPSLRKFGALSVDSGEDILRLVNNALGKEAR